MICLGRILKTFAENPYPNQNKELAVKMSVNYEVR